MSVTIDVYKNILYNCRTLYLFGAIGSIYLTLLIAKVEFSFVRLYTVIMLFIFALFYTLCLFHYHFSYAVYSYIIPIIISIFLVTDKIKGYLAILISLLLLINTKTIATIFNITPSLNLQHKDIIYIQIFEIITFLMSIGYSILIFNYFKEYKIIKNEYKKSINNDEYEKDNEVIFKGTIHNENNETKKLDALYNEIINHLITKKSYRNPDFSRKMLADILNTNTTYISKAIKHTSNENFNTLINQYRINDILQELNLGNHNAFTIEHIYTIAGFTNQPTFNRTFKEVTGKTPSEYIDSI